MSLRLITGTFADKHSSAVVKASQQFAADNKMPTWDYVLIPRTKGFEQAVEALGSHPAASNVSVIDVTIAFSRRETTTSLARDQVERERGKRCCASRTTRLQETVIVQTRLQAARMCTLRTNHCSDSNRHPPTLLDLFDETPPTHAHLHILENIASERRPRKSPEMRQNG